MQNFRLLGYVKVGFQLDCSPACNPTQLRVNSIMRLHILQLLPSSVPVAILAAVAVDLRLALISLESHPTTQPPTRTSLIGPFYELHCD